jgi:hypothetical protein
MSYLTVALFSDRTMYSHLAMDYASQGYMVLCPEFNDGSACLTVRPLM